MATVWLKSLALLKTTTVRREGFLYYLQVLHVS